MLKSVKKPPIFTIFNFGVGLKKNGSSTSFNILQKSKLHHAELFYRALCGGVDFI